MFGQIGHKSTKCLENKNVKKPIKILATKWKLWERFLVSDLTVQTWGTIRVIAKNDIEASELSSPWTRKKWELGTMHSEWSTWVEKWPSWDISHKLQDCSKDHSMVHNKYWTK